MGKASRRRNTPAAGVPTDITKHLVDAQAMHITNPDTFEVPDAAKLAEPQAGWMAKICDHEQRFWTQVVSADDAFITATVENHTGREGRGYGADQLIKYERRHVYVLHTPKENQKYSAQQLIQMLGDKFPNPTAEQQDLRALSGYIKTHWEELGDMFEQGADTAMEALIMPVNHEKVLAHFRTTPGLMERAGLDTARLGIEPGLASWTGLYDNAIGLAHIQSRADVAKLAGAGGSEPRPDLIDRLYDAPCNLVVAEQLACMAFDA